ncbi:hypothetical protein CVT24_010718 [Panaeolus cyanescens]|uniref:Uncharacterized protein n=1 Tax=Panaeolus cyanescens TaxID=181874 RepID=A0A409YVV3_9AGAR|nr:hypothetical protein CVT24_010718 [Panaeolus cyanescens]
MSANQWVALDDKDTRIKYEGSWFSTTPDPDINSLGNFGTPFQNSLRGINEDGNFTFTFTGSAVNALGTVKITQVDGVQDPSYECFLDGEKIEINAPLLVPENNWSLCSVNGLAVGPHTLTVRATVDKMTFWLDRLQFVPADNAEFDKQLNYLENDHPSILYDAGWGDLRGVGNLTYTFGSKATVSFTGRSLAWYGLIPSNYPIDPAPAAYSIDGGPLQNFLLNGLPSASSMEQYNQLFFQTPQLDPGDHTLEVVYHGNSNQTPLTIDYIIVQREGAVANTDTSVPTPAPTPPTPGPGTGTSGSTSHVIISSGSVIFQTHTVISSAPPHVSQSNSASDTKSKIPIGAIIGGCIGGFAVLVFLGWLCIVFRCASPRRRFESRRRLSRSGWRPPTRAPTLPVLASPSLQQVPTPPVSVTRFATGASSTRTISAPSAQHGHVSFFSPSQDSNSYLLSASHPDSKSLRNPPRSSHSTPPAGETMSPHPTPLTAPAEIIVPSAPRVGNRRFSLDKELQPMSGNDLFPPTHLGSFASITVHVDSAAGPTSEQGPAELPPKYSATP